MHNVSTRVHGISQRCQAVLQQKLQLPTVLQNTDLYWAVSGLIIQSSLIPLRFSASSNYCFRFVWIHVYDFSFYNVMVSSYMHIPGVSNILFCICTTFPLCIPSWMGPYVHFCILALGKSAVIIIGMWAPLHYSTFSSLVYITRRHIAGSYSVSDFEESSCCSF